MRISTRTTLILLSVLLGIAMVLFLAIAPNAVEESNGSAYKEGTVMTVKTSVQPVADYHLDEIIEEPKKWTEEEVIVLAKMLWGEARGIPSDTEKAACIWCVLNRVDNGMGSIVEVVTAPYQFVGYQEDHPVDPELKALCEDVLARWYQEKDGKTDVGRVLPSNYLFFTGDGQHNHFRNAYKNGDIGTWDYESPYED